ncbi:UvrD-helicase domain-containing protein [Rhabdaerophilum sp. SD176]|uniref:ATP-dependent helicase n=1 Tax=Rhabdaerophilum sp. SD176 TaxID=2983548 RepID=UPI0024DF3E30|nr:UvrD-helicase domain-containing protein [Rhabdaerophilum sp. SD176]
MSDPFSLDSWSSAEPAPKVQPQPGGLAARARAAAAPAAYLGGLNPEQLRAVEAMDGPVLVLAGAGTGKTKVLTSRIAHIIATGRARPNEILAMTFTNKAAREMKERIAHLVGAVAEGMPWLGTFHAIGTKLLRRHAEVVDLKPDFTILDTDDQIRLIKQILQAEDIDDKRWPARVLANQIDSWKNRALPPNKVSAGESIGFAGRGAELYGLYQDRLKTLNAVDFGDLLLETIRLFRDNPEILAQYQERFRYILVDEYQDTNVAQYLWLRLVAQGRRNICCVGDDDQSIYGWRGAEVDNILRFEKDFPGATVVRLERNYRSTGHILGAAARLIEKNEGRLGKTLFTEGELGDKVTVACAWDSEEEARQIADEIESLQHKGHVLDQMAILVRASFQMREFEERFITNAIPYRVIGGPRFYERAEIRDALAYLKCVASSSNDLAFERIINTPKRGIGDAVLTVLHGYARAERVPLMQAARVLVETEELKPKQRQTLRELMDSFSRWSGQIESLPHHELAELVLEESGYTDMWKKDRSADAAGRLENLKELVRSMEEFENLAGFLEHVGLVMDAASSDSSDRVSIMTLHAAKGLEFETVFLPGWEEGVFPHQRALDDQGKAGLEEERRLAYVGLTRAKRRARLFFATNRRIHGLWQAAIPSRFIDELPAEHVEVMEGQGTYGSQQRQIYGGGYGGGGGSRFDKVQPFQGSSYSTPGWQRAQAASQAGFRPSAAPQDPGRRGGPALIEGRVLASSTGSPSKFESGARVFHLKFGPGTVAEVDGNKLTVDFDKAGRKMVIDSFVQAG